MKMMNKSKMISTGHSTTVSDLIDEDVDRAFFRLEVIDGEDNPRPMVERFNSYFQENYYACPVFLPGTLGEALNNAFQTRSMQEVRLPLCFLWDRSLNHSSDDHCWSTYTATKLFSLVSSVRRSSPTRHWSSIWWTTTLSGPGTSLQKTTERGRLRFSTRFAHPLYRIDSLKCGTTLFQIQTSSTFALTSARCWLEWCNTLVVKNEDSLHSIMKLEFYYVMILAKWLNKD